MLNNWRSIIVPGLKHYLPGGHSSKLVHPARRYHLQHRPNVNNVKIYIWWTLRMTLKNLSINNKEELLKGSLESDNFLDFLV